MSFHSDAFASEATAVAEPSTPPVSDGVLFAFDAIELASRLIGRGLQESSLHFTAWPSSAGKPMIARCSPATDQPPRVVQVGTGWLARFDGQTDPLRVIDTQLTSESATIFVVAAVHEIVSPFMGMFAANARNSRDYQSGLTIDCGPWPSRGWEQLNVEGRGFGGAANLLARPLPVARLQVIEVSIDSQKQSVSLAIDGTLMGNRPFDPQTLSFDELTLGARYYTNEPGPQQTRGYFKGDIAAVVAYGRVLDENESGLMRRYLQDRYLSLNEQLAATLPPPAAVGIALEKVDQPPAVHCLVPGFEVKPLPIQLTNINNVRYRHDGQLVALAYSGDIFLLRDTNGDGLEDTAEVFWKNEGSLRGPIGMVLTPPDYSHGQGVIVASKGKISMLVDRDGDDRADEELIVATGWAEIAQNVDAVGLALADDGSLYFGLGTANFANPYLIDETGQAGYELHGERGTVQRISPDWQKREIIGTGVRFPIGFAFNSQGDLFCTEQEGATWLANGNAFDQLLHIDLSGRAPAANPTGKRHYGFPPRHPRHNPLVIDEPAVYEYAPQHQSTCGLAFNLPGETHSVFGPDWWQGDALVCGESRGKIWRTRLAQSQAGYVAESQLLACLQLLTVDCCISPKGDLVVACHSGPPDWGTGPLGPGQLFKISNRSQTLPCPVAVWANSPGEIQIAFDHPLDPRQVQGLAQRVEIQYGTHVRAGDRYEHLTPPYAIVGQQQQQPRFQRPVSGVSATADRRSLLLYTRPLSEFVHSAIRLPLGAEEIEIDFTPTGVQRAGLPLSPPYRWRGHLPHLDLSVSRQRVSHRVATNNCGNCCGSPVR